MSRKPRIKPRRIDRPDPPPRDSPRLVEIPPQESDLRNPLLINEDNSYLRFYRYGACSVIVTREQEKWHISISARDRLPTWEEIAAIRYALAPDDVTFAMILPKKESYINIHPNCLHLWELRADDFDAPVWQSIVAEEVDGGPDRN